MSNHRELHVFCSTKEMVRQAILFGFQDYLHSLHALNNSLYSEVAFRVVSPQYLLTGEREVVPPKWKRDLWNFVEEQGCETTPHMRVQRLELPELKKFLWRGRSVAPGVFVSDGTHIQEIEKVLLQDLGPKFVIVRTRPYNLSAGGATMWWKLVPGAEREYHPLDKFEQQVNVIRDRMKGLILNHFVVGFELQRVKGLGRGKGTGEDLERDWGTELHCGRGEMDSML